MPIVAFVLLAIGWVMWSSSTTSPSDTVEYRGQTIKLSKSFSDYDEYKDDPNNLAAEEVPKVQELVKSALVPQRVVGRQALTDAMFSLKFPGYGLGSYAATPQPDGSTLELWGVEIPKSDNMRFLLFRNNGGAYDLIDDFVYADKPMIGNVSAAGGMLVYSTQEGAKVVARTSSTNQ